MNQSAGHFDAGALDQSVSWPRWWRWTVIAVSAVTLCSCRSIRENASQPHVSPAAVPAVAVQKSFPGGTSAGAGDIVPTSAEMNVVGGDPLTPTPAPPSRILPVQHDSLPPSAYTGENYAGEHLPHCPRVFVEGEMAGGDMVDGNMVDGQTVPFWAQQWAPPGIRRPWPEQEYIHDGGDRGKPVRTGRDWQIHGLETEDTIAHFDTLDGQVMVEPSNRVHIYAPRFAAVRQVRGLEQYARDLRIQTDDVNVAAINQELALNPGAVLQPQAALDEMATRDPTIQQRNVPGLDVETTAMLREAVNKLMPHEDFAIIRDGTLEQADKPLLAIHVDAAITWSHDLGVKVVIDGQSAEVETGDQRAQATYTVDNPNKAKLRIVKVASREAARPGDIVEFTLRYDNTGTEPIGNVTIVDNLTTRLEYLPDSEDSSLKADFLTEMNDGGSLVLRWEIHEPLDVGQGGTIRFKCRVR